MLPPRRQRKAVPGTILPIDVVRGRETRDPTTVKTGDAYHHGDLKDALVAAAREALRSAPAESVTLKSLALRLGVSQPAPYRHFAGRDALMAAVAADGFVRFRRDLELAASGGPVENRFVRACHAYLAFGRENIGVYRLMFASPLMAGAARQGPLADAATAAFDLLVNSVRGAGAPDPRPTALVLWSALHGMVMLQAEGLLAGPADDHAALLEQRLIDDLAARFGDNRAEDRF